MDDPLVVGALFGALLGVVHGGYVYEERACRGVGPAVALYYAIWTFALWVVLGSYVLYLGLIAIPLFLIRCAARWARGARSSAIRWT
jgi:hypothetical protein